MVAKHDNGRSSDYYLGKDGRIYRVKDTMSL